MNNLRVKQKIREIVYRDISHSSFVDTASRIVEILEGIKGMISNGRHRDAKLLKIWIKGLGEEIYDKLLTRRYTDEKFKEIYNKYYASEEGSYKKYLAEIEAKIAKLSPKVKTKHWGGWFQNQFYPRSKHKILSLFKITYKEYYTLFLNPFGTRDMNDKAAWEGLPSIQKIYFFLEHIILPLTKRLNALNKKYVGGISFKIRDTLDGLIKHPDSIVIHYYKKELRPLIREIVKEIDDRETVFVLERGKKERSGFDLKDGNIEGFYGGSHGQILARLIAAEAISNPPVYWRDVNKMTTWLDQTLAKYKDLEETKAIALIRLEEDKLRKKLFDRNYLA
jgi:hypothetical protein